MINSLIDSENFVEKINKLSGVNDQESAGSDSATSPSEEETITDVLTLDW